MTTILMTTSLWEELIEFPILEFYKDPMNADGDSDPKPHN